MSNTRQSILQSLRDVRLIDPHSHINPHQPASTTLADILGYHYYTELVHSAGMPKRLIESADLSPRELVGRLVKGLNHLSNTAQHAWLLDICHRFFGFEDDVINESNWESLYDSAESTMQHADWADTVLEKSNVEGVFLTNDFDDKLTGFDTKTYIPCLRTDDLVFHLCKSEVRDRLAVCSGIDIDGSLKSLRDAIEQRFEHFVSNGARACAISLPPDFSPAPVSDGRAATALEAILRSGPSADESHKAAIARRVFWTIVELCDEFRLPMDLMIGVNRGVYAEGVFQGRDLYDSRVSLIQYRELFNAFPDVKFPVSVLASVTNQELVSYAWIFPNVITNGHWWYSNTPSFIRRDAAARLEAVPRNKQIGYYSDAYKLEFIAPKFDMYRRILAGILFDDFVVERGWSEEKAMDLGRQILRGNVDILFPDRSFNAAVTATESSSAQDDFSTALMPSVAAASLSFETGTADEKQDMDNVELADSEDLSMLSLLPSEDAAIEDELSYSTIIDFAPDSEHAAAGDTELARAVVTGDSNGIDLTDPFATLRLNDFVENEIDPETELEFFGDADEYAESINEEIEEIEEIADEPEPGLMLESRDDASDELFPAAEIRYFRADEMGNESLGDDFMSSEDVETVGLFSDPVTGELTMPIANPDDSSSEAIEETYLLPDEPATEYSSKSSLVDDVEVLEFEDLEPAPMDDDPELSFSVGDDSLSEESFDPAQTVDFEDNYEDDDSKKE